MPEVLRVRGHRFFFWSNDRPEPPHIHVETAEKKAKFWLNPVRLVRHAAIMKQNFARSRESYGGTKPFSWENGMNTSVASEETEVLARDVRFDEVDKMKVLLNDGREISVPIAWFPRLSRATDEQRRHWRFIGGGEGMHWEELDEDISVEGLLAGIRPTPSSAKYAASGRRTHLKRIATLVRLLVREIAQSRRRLTSRHRG